MEKQIDPNFEIAEKLGRDPIVFYPVTEPPFRLYGVMAPSGDEPWFRRMPHTVASQVSDGVRDLNKRSAGGRVRFQTDSAFIGVKGSYSFIGRMPHFSLSGSAGFDLYTGSRGKEEYVRTLIPPLNTEKTFALGGVVARGGEMKEYTINLPLYSALTELSVILDAGASIEMAEDYLYEKPIVFYGSSITQGGCASRSGASYEAVIARRFGTHYLNLGFSGNAKGEEIMAKYIASLDMSVFVYDYDHNATLPEDLAATHEKFFRIVREAKPDIPILCLSRVDAKTPERQAIIRKTVENAVAQGDRNVYFVPMFEECRALFGGVDATMLVDGCHPNDLGFWCMAKVVGDKLAKLGF